MENVRDCLERPRHAILKLKFSVVLQTQQSQNSLREVEVYCPFLHHHKTNSLTSICKIHHQGDIALLLGTGFKITSLHLQQRLPGWARRTNILATRRGHKCNNAVHCTVGERSLCQHFCQLTTCPLEGNESGMIRAHSLKQPIRMNSMRAMGRAPSLGFALCLIVWITVALSSLM